MSRFVNRILPWLALIHALLFIAFWLTNSLFYASTNDFLTNKLGRQLDYVSLLLWISAIFAPWSCILGILSSLRNPIKQPCILSALYGLVALVYIIFFYASFAILFGQSPVQLPRIAQLIGYFRLIIDPILLLGLTLAAGLSIRNMLMKRTPQAGKPGWTTLAIPVAVYAILWGLLFLFPPSSVIDGSLPNKPLIIARRGASMLAPENTDAAANRAVQLGVSGLETDIQVSADGQLFLMHDTTLARTTDVATVFPGREDLPASDFTMAEIQQLNAGEWFVRQDPFHAIKDGLVTPEQVQEYQQQSVPPLSDWIDIVRNNHLVFIFDLKQPGPYNTFAPSFFDLVLNQLSESLLGSQVWFLVDESHLQTLRHLAPDMVPAYGANYRSPPAPRQIYDEGYLLVNAEYGLASRWIKQYHDANVWVNLYTVDEPWLFSRWWTLGADSMTTSNVQAMAALTRPILSLLYNQYRIMWSAVGIAVLALLIGLIYPGYKRQ